MSAETIVRLRDQEGKGWPEIAQILGENPEKCRSTYRRAKGTHERGRPAPTETAPEAEKRPVPTVEAKGVPALEPLDEEEVYRRALLEYDRTTKRQVARATQKLHFSHGPVCLVFLGDQHFGDGGVNYRRAFEEAELVRDTPGCYAVLMGDLCNNFVIGKLRQARDKARLNIPDEWALVRRYLKILAPKLVASVGGNHDAGWSEMLLGVDYFREVLAQIKPDVIYDQDDSRINVTVGDVSFPGRIRHRWSGRSQWNVTHAIEKAFKWDADFLWAAGAHYHPGAAVRSFNAAGENGMAIMCGSYKAVDAYPRRLGLPKPSVGVAAALVLDADTYSMTGFENLSLAARFMQALYGGERAA